MRLVFKDELSWLDFFYKLGSVEKRVVVEIEVVMYLYVFVKFRTVYRGFNFLFLKGILF